MCSGNSFVLHKHYEIHYQRRFKLVLVLTKAPRPLYLETLPIQFSQVFPNFLGLNKYNSTLGISPSRQFHQPRLVRVLPVPNQQLPRAEATFLLLPVALRACIDHPPPTFGLVHRDLLREQYEGDRGAVDGTVDADAPCNCPCFVVGLRVVALLAHVPTLLLCTNAAACKCLGGGALLMAFVARHQVFRPHITVIVAHAGDKKLLVATSDQRHHLFLVE
mmetsp:Transcript_50410/g.114535  ORF Transcript_50410/g.114535 Transcript_50410/m.114535 type:complete len:219 (-) Transcript_50410:973-1629(-)